ncbi:hypothetical protein BKA93DRAFT_182459 [Sparassis latifolia]
MSEVSPTAAVSSSSTLWATASKEWVIPAKPKPGRKPKKESIAPVEEPAQLDSKGRRVQNRAAQRAFRERKQSQLAELQARVQQYEQGEVERNVQLQNIAKRLKEENESLKTENALLKEKVEQLSQTLTLQDGVKKRSREPSLQSLNVHFVPHTKKKAKLSTDPQSTVIPSGSSTHSSSPSSLGSPPSPTDSSHTGFSPIPPFLSSHDVSSANVLKNIFDISSDGKGDLFENNVHLDSCGFCNETLPCVCRDMQLEQAAETMSLAEPSTQDLGTADLNPSVSNSTRPSILDNPPAYQPPVPLRRRVPNPSFHPVFPVYSASSDSSRGVSCSGDPSNCLACADDVFGKAFCSAISKSVACTSQCGDCPNFSDLRRNNAILPGCCGNPAFCGSTLCGGGSTTSATLSPESSSSVMMSSSSSSETMPCNDAWRQIKSHPNVAYTDLTLLAEVVARRSKCDGPSVEICSAPERGLTPVVPPVSQQAETLNQPVLLTDPHAHYHRSQRRPGSSPPPQLVPQEVLIRCGRQRVREVMADGVRDALRLLDAKFSLP